tara:strand:- start:843 stop:1115 length:273 start_codon:yes stop_codon:yes gene_type:complete
MGDYVRKCVASSELFSGFTVEIDIRYIDNIGEIINYFKKQLFDVLKKNNLLNLIDKLKITNFHIHTHNLNEILLNKEIIYICDHCDVVDS